VKREELASAAATMLVAVDSAMGSVPPFSPRGGCGAVPNGWQCSVTPQEVRGKESLAPDFY